MAGLGSRNSGIVEASMGANLVNWCHAAKTIVEGVVRFQPIRFLFGLARLTTRPSL